MKRYATQLLISLLLVFSAAATAQQPFVADTLDGRVYVNGLPVFTAQELAPFKSVPRLIIDESIRQRILPEFVDNSQLPYFRPIFNQTSLECGQAAGVSYLFTYEINRLRDLPSNVPENQYPSHFVFNWSNAGGGHANPYFDSWNIIKELGTPTVSQYGGSQNFGGVTRWMNGYDAYYQAMHNRLWDFYTIPLNDADDLEVLRHWIDNHTKGEETGGVAVFYASFQGVNNYLPPGTPEAGKAVIPIMSPYANHALTVVGYHDSIRFDLNNDGQYTNHLDINGDGVVDILDWEIGGVKIANSFGATSWGNQGFAYLLYSALCRPLHLGGVWNRAVHVVNAKDQTQPPITYKATITHNSREKIKVMAGVAAGFDAEFPEYIIEFPVLNYQGGNLYMQGGSSEADKTLEFGLDVTRLLRYLESGQDATFFILVNEKDPWNGGTGSLDYFALIDYTDGMVEIAAPQTNVPLVENGLTMLKVNAQVSFDAPEIIIQGLEPATINEPYQMQMLAAGGNEPYQWKIKQNYLSEYGNHPFPEITAQQLNPSSSTNGIAVKEIDFDFPFYGETYNKISVHTDGYLMFTEEPYPWIFLVDELVLFKNLKNISPYMCKPLGISGGGEMWYEGDQNKATFRWRATEHSTNNILNFAVSLYPSGKIEFFYGDIVAAYWNKWHAGISGGDDLNYVLLDISNTYNIQPNTMATIEPDFATTEMKITEDGLLHGTPTQPYEAVDIEFFVKDVNGLKGSKVLPFFTDGINKIVIRNVTVTSGDDHIIEYGESVSLSVELQNISAEVVDATEMLIATQDPHVTLVDHSVALTSFQPGQTIVFEDAFAFDVDLAVPNNHNIIFSTEIMAPQETFNSYIYLKAYAPALAIGAISFDDGNNGYPEPGETIEVNIAVINSGGGKAYNLEALLSNNDPLVNINQSAWTTDVLDGGAMASAKFEIHIDESAPIGHFSQLNLHATADHGFSASDIFLFSIGYMVEDFETGDFSSYDWQFSGAAPWFVTNEEPYEGVYCMRSGAISHNEHSVAKVTMNVVADGEISFYYKVSSESNYDFLTFSIDGNSLGSWSGNIGWTQATFTVQAGERTFEWKYDKDFSVSHGSDCAWVDYIVFPPVAPEGLMVFAGVDKTTCEDTPATMQAVVSNAATIEWTTSGDGSFSDPHIQNPIYHHSDNDVNSGSVQLTLTVSDDSGNTLSDDMTLSFAHTPVIMAGNDQTICAGQSVSLAGSTQYAGSVAWFTNGDGTFENPGLLQTIYHPGPGDIAAGGVIIGLEGQAITPCLGEYSDLLEIIILALPEVIFSEIEDLCLDSPAIELTEGFPAGGDYSGPGVMDGWFHPEIAGIGLHVLTYDYVDENGCENSATTEVFVDDCTAVPRFGLLAFNIFPNPGDGRFNLQFDQKISGVLRVEIFNTAGNRVFADAFVVNDAAVIQQINLSSQPDGVYYMRLTGSGISASAKLVIRK